MALIIDNNDGEYCTMDDTIVSTYAATLKDSQFLRDLIQIHDFYKHVAYNCYLFIPIGTR